MSCKYEPRTAVLKYRSTTLLCLHLRDHLIKLVVIKLDSSPMQIKCKSLKSGRSSVLGEGDFPGVERNPSRTLADEQGKYEASSCRREGVIMKGPDPWIHKSVVRPKL